jgi:hypothetical protein
MSILSVVYGVYHDEKRTSPAAIAGISVPKNEKHAYKRIPR